MRKRVTLLVMALLLLFNLSALAQEAAPFAGQMEATLGYDGQITYLRMLPLTVTIKNDGADIKDASVSLRVNRSNALYDEYVAPVNVAGGATVSLSLPIYVSTKQASFDVQLTQNGRLLSSVSVTPKRTFDPKTLLIGVLSAAPDALSYWNITAINDPLSRGELWQTVALNRETFPKTRALLSSFSMLVVDGVDVQSLDQAQQTALDEWLTGGGIVLVGGGAQAAEGYPFFTRYSGLTAGAPYETPDISQALLRSFQLNGKPCGGTQYLCQVDGGNTPLISGDAPLVYLNKAGSGLLYQTTFSLSDKPLASFLSSITFGQRLLLSSAVADYQKVMENLNNYYGLLNDGQYLDSSLTINMPVQNDANLLPAVLLSVLFLLMVGFGGYFLLKRFDKREWLWALIPCAAVLCSLLIWLTGGFSHLRDPIAVTVSQVSIKNGVTSLRSTASIASADVSPLTVSATDADITLPVTSAGSYETYEEPSTVEPKLHYRYTYLDNVALTLPKQAAWKVRTFNVKPSQTPNLPLSAQVYEDADGVHATITNQSDYFLPQGFFLGMRGYASVPALAPGQSVECAILRDEAREKTLIPTLGYEMPGAIMDGVLMPAEQMAYCSIYSVLYAAVYPEGQTDGTPITLPEEVMNDKARQSALSMYQSAMYGWGNSQAEFHYVSIDDALVNVTLSVNGQPVTRSTNRTVVDVQAEFVQRAKNGRLYYPAGLLVATEGGVNSLLEPYELSTISSRNGWYDLSVKPIFCITLPQEARTLVPDLFTLNFTSTDFQLEIYNQRAGKWETTAAQSLPVGEKFADYVSENAQIFVRCRASGTSTGSYDVKSPAISLEGRVK